jgi:hypothetical protein
LRMCSISARGLWMEMLCIMHEAEPRGSLLINGRPVSERQMVSLTGATLREIHTWVAELELAGVFSRDDNGTIYSRRMKRDQEKSEQDKANGKAGGNPSLKGGVNPPDKAQKLEARDQKLEARNQIEEEEEKKERTRASALAPSHTDSQFDQFWEAYPHKVGQEAARKAWLKACLKIELPQLMAALLRYRNKLDDRPWCNPATWLNQERWEDVPAPPVVPQNRDPQKQGLNDALAKLREYNQSGTGSRNADPKLYESSGIRPAGFSGGVGTVVERLPRHRMDTGPDQWDSGEVSVLPYPRRHQG